MNSIQINQRYRFIILHSWHKLRNECNCKPV